MIYFIPFTRFEFRLYRSAVEVEKQLSELVGPRMLIRKTIFSKRVEGLPFHGTVENGRFNFKRVIYYRNSYLPVISGDIHDDLGMIRVAGRMHPHWLVMVLSLAFMLVFVVSSFVPFFINGKLDQLIPMLGPVIGLLAVFYLAVMAFFNYEANKAYRLLQELFQEGGDL